MPIDPRSSEDCIITPAVVLGLDVFWTQAGAFCNSGKHPRTDLNVVVKCEYEVGPIDALENPVRSTRLALDGPTYPQKRGENDASFRCGPAAHAVSAKTRSNSGTG